MADRFKRYIDSFDREHYEGEHPDGSFGIWVTRPGFRFCVDGCNLDVVPKNDPLWLMIWSQING